MARRGWVVVAGLVCATTARAQITGVEGRVPPPTEADWSRIVGSYHLRLCRRGSACLVDADPEVLGTFFVSLQRHAMALDSNVALMVGGVPSRDANACYATEQVRPVHRSYAGQIGAGMFTVAPRSDEPDISVVLGGSVDAFYIATVVIQNGRLEGIGRSVSVPENQSTAWPKDTVVGIRTGPPDPTPCIAVGRALMAKWRRGESP